MTSLSSVPIADFEQVNTCSANIYLFKVNNSNTGKRYEICSKLIINIKTNKKQKNLFHTFSSVPIVEFE